MRLTVTKYELLRLLAVEAGLISTCELLIRWLWSRPDGGDADRVPNIIKQLRCKLGDETVLPCWILNGRCVSYRVHLVVGERPCRSLPRRRPP